jgi:hypothetical protein
MADSIGVELTGDNAKFAGMIDGSIGVVNKFNQVLGALGVGISLGGLISFFKEVADKTGKIQDLSERLGASTDALQAFSYASQQAGATTEQATAAWDKAKRAVDSLVAGEATAAKMFGRIGLSAKDFIGLNMDQSLERIASGYRANEGAAGAYEAVTDILGSKTAPRLNTVLLQLGAEGFQAFIDQAQKAGHLIGGETIKAVDTFGDALEREKGRLNTWGANAAGVAIVLQSIPKALVAIIEKSTGIDIPFAGLEKKVEKAVEKTKELLPQIEILTAEGKKQILQQMESARLGDEKLSREERMKLLKADLATIDEQLAKSGLTQFEIDGLRVMQAETKKLIKGDEKVLDADAKKHAERMEEMTAKEIADRRALLTTEERIAELKSDEAGWVAVLAEKGIEASVRQNAEYELAKTRADMRPLEAAAERDRLAILQAQEGVLEQQLATAKAITLTVSRTGKSYEQQSDDSLEGVRNRLRQQIDQLKREDFGRPGGVGGKGKPAELYLLESELSNLDKEFSQRQEVRDYASRFGEQKARQQFGDTLTEKSLRDWTDLSSRSTTALEDIQQRLQLLFPKK